MRHANPTFRISERERNDLLKAWILTSVAFAVFFIRTGLIVSDFVTIFVLAVLTAGVGFIVHELCHKIAAHRFNVHGEFVANTTMLYVSILFAFFGFIFAAPGAVHMAGHIARREHGLIAAAGPASNMVLVALFYPLTMFGGFISLVGIFGMLINAILGAFNLIPFLGLDGSKILAWDVKAYGALVVIAVLQVGYVYTMIL